MSTLKKTVIFNSTKILVVLYNDGAYARKYAIGYNTAEAADHCYKS